MALVLFVKHIHAYVPFHELQRPLLCQRGRDTGNRRHHVTRDVGDAAVIRRCVTGSPARRIPSAPAGRQGSSLIQPGSLADFAQVELSAIREAEVDGS